jgi:hypothetical protein
VVNDLQRGTLGPRKPDGVQYQNVIAEALAEGHFREALAEGHFEKTRDDKGGSD